MGWSTLALSTLSSASISLEKAMSSGTPASAISVVGDARTSRTRDAGMITRCLSRGANFERSAGRVCGGSSASIDGGRLQLFRKLAQLKALFRPRNRTGKQSHRGRVGAPKVPIPFLTSCVPSANQNVPKRSDTWRTDSQSRYFIQWLNRRATTPSSTVRGVPTAISLESLPHELRLRLPRPVERVRRPQPHPTVLRRRREGVSD